MYHNQTFSAKKRKLEFVIAILLFVGVLCLLERIHAQSKVASPGLSAPLTHQDSFRNYDSVYLDLQFVSGLSYVQNADRFHTEAKYYEVKDVSGDYYLIRVYPSITSSLNAFSSAMQSISKNPPVRVYGVSGTIESQVMDGIKAATNEELTAEEFHERYGYNVLSVGMERKKTLNTFWCIWGFSLLLALWGFLRFLKIC